jgi:hypothetical protein
MLRWLNAIGLTLGIIGVIFIWKWGLAQPSFERGVSIGAEENTVFKDGRSMKQMNADKAAAEALYKRKSRIGLSLILAGFACQLANEFVPKP